MNLDTTFYDIHQMHMNGESCRAGVLAIEATAQGRIERMQFRYNPEYLGNRLAAPISPLLPNLTEDTYSFPSDGHSFVGFIDDLLPDDWGKRIIARRLGKKHITNLTALNFIGGGASIGANKVTSIGEKPNWSNGVSIGDAETTIEALYNGDIDALNPDQLEAIHLVQGGSQVGGARPKMLVIDKENSSCLIKPNLDTDKFDYAAAEWASLEVCRIAGIPTADAYIYTLNKTIRSLMIKRFDISDDGGRYELATINSLLKDPTTQCDALNYSYEDIADCIRKFSHQPKEDLDQLFGQLLINQALSNTDDHLRNFSMMRTVRGWQLSPVYDVLPQQMHRGEHACTFNNSGFLPILDDYANTGKKLGLRKNDCESVAERVAGALQQWPEILASTGLINKSLEELIITTQKGKPLK